jgi:non-canonical poly(A) RNA polymerase PAPD5/7
MTFSAGGGDSYVPGGQRQNNHSEFTFHSNRPAPEFPPSDPRGPARSNRRSASRGGRRDRPRNNANGNRRSGPRRKEAPHERALLQHQDAGSPERTYGVDDGPNRFMNVDDMSDHDETDMVESDASTDGENPNGKHKVARTGASRADGDAVPEFKPRWSNPDPYTACPPPSETTGVKKDVVQLIRKAKNEAATKAIGNNAVAANDDFISFDADDAEESDAEESDDASDHQPSRDNESIHGRAHGKAPQRHEWDSVDDSARHQDPRYDLRDVAYDSYQPEGFAAGKKRRAEERNGYSGSRKRKADDDIGIVKAWLPVDRLHPAPWATKPQYQHLAKTPEKW